MPSALHVYPTAFTHESRILKETRSLAESGLFSPIFIGAIWQEGLAEREMLDRNRSVWRVRMHSRSLPGLIGKLVRFAEWYARIVLHFRKAPPDFVNCHSLSTLPLGVLFRLLFRSRVIYDTHELETETHTSVGLRRTLARIVERHLIRHVEAVIVVSGSIGEWYRNAYRIDEVHVVRNIPYSRGPLSPRTAHLREALGLDAAQMLFLYQGLIDESRGIRLMLEAFARTRGDRHVCFMGFGPDVDEVRAWAARHANIHYHPAVPPDRVLEYTSGADVGITFTENTSLSHYYSLPNKVFEYIASGIPVIVSNLPEMAKLVETWRCGWTCEVGAASLSTLVARLTRADIAAAAEGAAASASVLSWSTEEAVLLALYRRLLDVTPAPRTGARDGGYTADRGNP